MLEKYLKEISDNEPLEKKEELRLLKLAKEGNQMAYNKVIEANLKFVISVAKKYQGQGLDLDELVSEGNLGLVRAFHKFDTTRGVKFITYGVWWIRQAILNALHENAKLIRLPLNKITNVTKIGKAQDILRETLNREPSEEEISTYLDDPNVLKDLQYNYTIIGLDTPFTNDGKDLNNVIPDEDAEDPKHYEEEFQKELEDIIKDFPEREKIIIRMYYGIGYLRAFTLKEIGKEFNLTRERIRQIKEKVIKKLRIRHRKEKLRLYL